MRLLAYGGLTDWPFGDLEPHSFDFIMADPPWNFGLWSENGEEKSPQAQYTTMSLEAIKALPVLDLAAENCVLWLWATNPMLPQAIETLLAWGFAYKTAGTWLKTTKNDKLSFGTGYILRSASEPFLIGTRGRPTTARNVRSAFFGRHRGHSRKPLEGYREAEKLMPKASRIELFSRADRKGWQTWGDEIGKFGEET